MPSLISGKDFLSKTKFFNCSWFRLLHYSFLLSFLCLILLVKLVSLDCSTRYTQEKNVYTNSRVKMAQKNVRTAFRHWEKFSYWSSGLWHHLRLFFVNIYGVIYGIFLYHPMNPYISRWFHNHCKNLVNCLFIEFRRMMNSWNRHYHSLITLSW